MLHHHQQLNLDLQYGVWSVLCVCVCVLFAMYANVVYCRLNPIQNSWHHYFAHISNWQYTTDIWEYMECSGLSLTSLNTNASSTGATAGSISGDHHKDCLPHLLPIWDADECSAHRSNLFFGCLSAAAQGLKNAFVLVQISRFQQIIGVFTLQAPSEAAKVRMGCHMGHVM